MNSILTLAKIFVKYLRQYPEHNKYEFWNYSTLRFRYEENKMEGKHLEDNHIERKGTYCSINDIGISNDQPAFSFVISKIICPKKNTSIKHMGSNPQYIK